MLLAPPFRTLPTERRDSGLIPSALASAARTQGGKMGEKMQQWPRNKIHASVLVIACNVLKCFRIKVAQLTYFRLNAIVGNGGSLKG